MVWTEIMHENVGVTHVDGYHVIIPLDDDVSIRVVNEIKDNLQRRHAIEQINRQYKELGEQLERQRQAAERLRGTEYEGLI